MEIFGVGLLSVRPKYKSFLAVVRHKFVSVSDFNGGLLNMYTINTQIMTHLLWLSRCMIRQIGENTRPEQLELGSQLPSCSFPVNMWPVEGDCQESKTLVQRSTCVWCVFHADGLFFDGVWIVSHSRSCSASTPSWDATRVFALVSRTRIDFSSRLCTHILAVFNTIALCCTQLVAVTSC